MIARSASLRRITLNSIWLLVGRVLSQGLTFAFGVMLARYLGAGGLGRYAFVTSVVFLANTLTTFGTDTLIIRRVSRERSGESPWPIAALIVQLVLSGLLIALLIVMAGYLPGASPESAAALRRYSLALIPLALSTVFSAVLRGHERMDLYTAFTLVTSAVQAFGGLLVLSLGGRLPAIVAMLAAAHVAGAVASVVAVRTLRPDFRLSWRVSMGHVRSLLVEGLPLFALMGLSILYQRLGLFALIFLQGDAAAGFFAAPLRLIDALRIVPYAVLGALFPAAARVAASGSRPPRFGVVGDLPEHALLVFALVLSIVLTAVAAPLIHILFGPAYAASVVPLQCLVWSLVPYVIGARASLHLVASDREQVVLRATALTLPVALALHALLIARWGVLGASVATFAAETLYAAILLIAMRRRP